MTALITCSQCGKRRLPARRDAIFCGDCYAEIGRDMDKIARGETEPDAEDLFARIERNNRKEPTAFDRAEAGGAEIRYGP